MAKRTPAPRETRQRILDAALQVFGERGYLSASVDDVAAAAGVTKGAVYYWFTDKDDLARDLQTMLWERLKNEAMAALDPNAGTIENLTRSFDAYLHALRNLGSARFFLRDMYSVPAGENAARDERETGVTLLRGLLEQGIARGDLMPLDPAATARVLIGAYNEATLHVLETGNDLATRAVIDRFVRALAMPNASRTRPKASRTRTRGRAR